MNISTILLLIVIVLVGIYSIIFLDLNQTVVHLDLIFLELDQQLGLIILTSFLIGIVFAFVLELIFFSSKRKKKNE